MALFPMEFLGTLKFLNEIPLFLGKSIFTNAPTSAFASVNSLFIKKIGKQFGQQVF